MRDRESTGVGRDRDKKRMREIEGASEVGRESEKKVRDYLNDDNENDQQR